MTAPFDALLEREPLLRHRELLLSYHVPSHLPGREKEAGDLARALLGLLHGDAAPHVSVTGPPGCGKSALARSILHQLGATAKDRGIPLRVVALDGRAVRTHYRVLAQLVNHYARDRTERVPSTGIPTTEVHGILAEQMRREGSRLVVLLDHADELLAHASETVLEDLLGLDAVIVTTASTTIRLRQLAPTLGGRLLKTEIPLRAYSASELQAILAERAQHALRQNTAHAAILGTIATAAQGNAAEALALLDEAARLADDAGAEHLAPSHVERARAQLHAAARRDAIDVCTPQERTVLSRPSRRRRARRA